MSLKNYLIYNGSYDRDNNAFEFNLKPYNLTLYMEITNRNKEGFARVYLDGEQIMEIEPLSNNKTFKRVLNSGDHRVTIENASGYILIRADNS